MSQALPHEMDSQMHTSAEHRPEPLQTASVLLFRGQGNVQLGPLYPASQTPQERPVQNPRVVSESQEQVPLVELLHWPWPLQVLKPGPGQTQLRIGMFRCQ